MKFFEVSSHFVHRKLKDDRPDRKRVSEQEVGFSPACLLDSAGAAVLSL